MTTDPRARLERVLGPLSPAWEDLLDRDPEFVEAFAGYLAACHDATVLRPHIRELLLLAHDATMTVLDERGVDLRIGRALDAGATEREVLDVLELLTLISTHSLTTGIPLVPVDAEPPAPESTRGGYWAAFEERFPGYHARMAALMPEAFAAYRGLGRVLWRSEGLPLKWRELVFVVADLSTTHLFRDGAALHVANALRYGATRAEVVAAIGLTVPYTARTLEIGVAALARRLGAPKPPPA
ncbi:carboxymuconolactone decarboxylase family protein [Saccharopolyspora phatthalungensis]|uniref:Alkylhydroperoxidase/carboxymuconolactone decarboxylase family protein YurZ n=1 Tax=Saccharopolyspora phatthalungensis TaxID=664693 RepID=A0A840QFV2_9PSEU|nr:carboxymuconolactone decarboxylase family protein [Saccharopolyspora phatthalungensis]MBB5158967.1 alkylhydroperoxidase/carboxymuconolactone decarboxylase family protein YurZ [Saccharopolyspora phatthalungensis]